MPSKADEDATVADRSGHIELVDENTLRLVPKMKIFRFLFSDGTTIDVHAVRDDSDLRSLVRAYCCKDTIEGVARLPEQGALL